jgi:hypothetical protein
VKSGIQLIQSGSLSGYPLKVISGERSEDSVWDIIFVTKRNGGLPKVVDGSG